jgi:hypothetical protein
VGDRLAAVNGRPLAFGARGDPFDAALALIAAAGRPLNITFLRGLSAGNAASAVAAAAAAASAVATAGEFKEPTEDAPLDAFDDEKVEADATSGTAFHPEGGGDPLGLLPVVEEEASTATWLSSAAGEGSAFEGSLGLLESSQSELVDLSESRLSFSGGAGPGSVSFGGSFSFGGSGTLGGVEPSLSAVHAGDEPASVGQNQSDTDSAVDRSRDDRNSVSSPLPDRAERRVNEANETSGSGTAPGSGRVNEATRGAAGSSSVPAGDEPAFSLADHAVLKAAPASEATSGPMAAAAGADAAAAATAAGVAAAAAVAAAAEPVAAAQQPVRGLFGGTAGVLQRAKDQAAARRRRRGVDLAGLDLRVLEQLLEGLKAGWGPRFAPAFAAVGLEDVDDLADVTPDEMVRPRRASGVWGARNSEAVQSSFVQRRI